MSNRTTFGIISLGLGISWLLSNYNIITFPGFWGIISIALISLGAWQLVASNFQTVGSPLTLIIIGMTIGLFQLNLLSFEDLGLIFWPAILILVGISTLLSRHPRTKGEPVLDSRKLSIAHIFGGGKVINASNDFKGGEIINVFGGGTIDLSEARVSKKPAHMAITIVFGGSDFIIPDDWSVENRALTLFGGIDDKRKKVKISKDDEATPDLIISGIVLFGGFDIK